MPQGYHTNAKTNSHSREIIQQSTLTNIELSKRFEINEKTVSKWKNREYSVDKSSRPHTVQHSLTDLEREIIRVVRTLTWMELDGLVDCVVSVIPKANRSHVYRTLVAFNINRVPEEKKEKAKKFKEYEPGYLHIDVTYMPKLEGVKYLKKRGWGGVIIKTINLISMGYCFIESPSTPIFQRGRSKEECFHNLLSQPSLI